MARPLSRLLGPGWWILRDLETPGGFPAHSYPRPVLGSKVTDKDIFRTSFSLKFATSLNFSSS